MTSNVVNTVPYIRTTRSFPEGDLHQLTVEVNRAYLDIANSINSRVIGIFPINRPAISGEAWYITQGRQQQALRQVYTFTSTASIPHNIKFTNITQFSKAYGVFTDGTNWYGIIFGSNVAISGQISFYITPTNIVFLTGGGAPTLTYGSIVLEWLSNV